MLVTSMPHPAQGTNAVRPTLAARRRPYLSCANWLAFLAGVCAAAAVALAHGQARTPGALVGWGNNSLGQLPDNPPGLSGVSGVSATAAYPASRL